MVFDRARTDAKLTGNILIRQATSGQGQHFIFTRGQLPKPLADCVLGRRFGAAAVIFDQRGGDALEQLLGAGRFSRKSIAPFE